MHDSFRWVPADQPVELDFGQVDVWRVSVPDEESIIRKLEAPLASDEKERANRFVVERSRNEFVVTRAILRGLLGKYLGVPPESLKFDYNPKGKPFLASAAANRPIQFSVSHSHGLALLAFAIGFHLGVDVELIRPDFASDEIAERYFSRQEVAELRALPPPMRSEGFFLCWTRKEAYIKAKGEGLQIPLKSFQVSLTPGNEARLESEDSSNWDLFSLQPGSGHVGALVTERKGRQLHLWDWKP